jgi:hypothetical protein
MVTLPWEESPAMTAHKEGDTTVVDTDEARAGKTGVGLRYVLAISLVVVIGGMFAVLLLMTAGRSLFE